MRFRIKFGLEVGELRSAAAGAGRIAALRHEPWNDTVELDPVIEAVAGKADDPLDMAGGNVGAEADDDITAGGQSEGQGVGVGHGRILLGLKNLGAM